MLPSRQTMTRELSDALNDLHCKVYRGETISPDDLTDQQKQAVMAANARADTRPKAQFIMERIPGARWA